MIKDSLFTQKTSWLWLGGLLMAVLPQMISLRIGPQPTFLLELCAFVMGLFFVVFTIISGKIKAKIPAASIYFLILAAFWAIQARVMHLTYIALSDIVSWTFVVLALVCWACREWKQRLGLERVLSILAGVLLMGSLFQAVVGLLQYTGFAQNFGFLIYREGIVEGQFGQRNQLAHYLMWGILSSGWLWSQRRLPAVLALGVMGFLAVVMGLIGSRTIFAYILMLGVLLLGYRLFSGSQTNRVLIGLAIATVFVLVGQVVIEPILGLFQTANIHSAASRLGEQFDGSGRFYEWRKAWQIFLSAPIFGQGWGSYAYQGFLQNVYSTGFRSYDTSSLFTHSHNSFLNLLAEMGLLGTILVVGGWIYCIGGCFKRIHIPASLFLLALMGVSLTHSAVEHPLWYIYFLVPFALFMGCVPDRQDVSDEMPRQAIVANKKGLIVINVVAFAMSALLIQQSIRVGFTYLELSMYFIDSTGEVSQLKYMNDTFNLERIAKDEPMLRYYAQQELVSYIDVNEKEQPQWVDEVLKNAVTYRPYGSAHKYAFMLYRQGKTQEARDFMQAIYRYYPVFFPTYAPWFKPNYSGLYDDYIKTCHAYYTSVKRVPECGENAASEPSKP